MLSAHQVASTLTSRYFSTIDADAVLQKSVTEFQLESDASRLTQARSHLITRAQTVIEEMILVLDRDIALLAFADALVASSVTTLDQVRAHGVAIFDYANKAAGFDVVSRLPESSASSHSVEEPIDFAKLRGIVAESMQAKLQKMPLRSFITVARELEQPELAHRLRRNFETLLALTNRASANWEPRLKEASQLYLSGRLEVPEIARLVGVSPAEVAAEFERLGVLRDLDALSLSESERDGLLNRIVSRGPVDDAVRREVIASQRIEGIDARPHLELDRLR